MLWQGPGTVTVSVGRGKRGDTVNINRSRGEQASSPGRYVSAAPGCCTHSPHSSCIITCACLPRKMSPSLSQAVTCVEDDNIGMAHRGSNWPDPPCAPRRRGINTSAHLQGVTSSRVCGEPLASIIHFTCSELAKGEIWASLALLLLEKPALHSPQPWTSGPVCSNEYHGIQRGGATFWVLLYAVTSLLFPASFPAAPSSHTSLSLPSTSWACCICLSSVNISLVLLSQFSSITQSCPTLSDPMVCSMPGFPVHHQLPEPTQSRVIASVRPSNHLILCHPLLLPPSIFPSIRVFSNESVLHIRWPKYWSFSFRTDFL